MSKDPGSIPGTSTIWFGPRLVQLEFGSAWIGIQLTSRGPGFSQRKFIYLVRQIAIAEVETPISPMIVDPRLMFSTIRKAPLRNANPPITRMKINRNFEMLSLRQSESINTSGPPYMAGETIIATARASDSTPQF